MCHKEAKPNHPKNKLCIDIMCLYYKLLGCTFSVEYCSSLLYEFKLKYIFQIYSWISF